jgi:hypothetical protein
VSPASGGKPIHNPPAADQCALRRFFEMGSSEAVCSRTQHLVVAFPISVQKHFIVKNINIFQHVPLTYHYVVLIFKVKEIYKTTLKFEQFVHCFLLNLISKLKRIRSTEREEATK